MQLVVNDGSGHISAALDADGFSTQFLHLTICYPDYSAYDRSICGMRLCNNWPLQAYLRADYATHNRALDWGGL